MMQLKNLKKKKETKSRHSRRHEVTKLSAETNERGTTTTKHNTKTQQI